MGTAIEWSDEVWNPTVGCSRVSPGCDNCYAIGVAHRAMQPAHEGLTIRAPGKRTDWTGEVRQLPDRLDVPFRWRKPRRVFVNSMSDLFHPEVPEEFVVDVLARAALTRRHTYQVLTKRPQRMTDVLALASMRERVAEEATEIIGRTGPYDRWRIETDLTWTPVDDGQGSNLWLPPWPLPNLWAGTSIESDRYTFRADHVRATPAAVRFLSLEPLLGPLPSLDLTGIDWVIIGGESGHDARALDLGWVRDLIAQARAADTAVFVKQLGRSFDGRKGNDIDTWPEDLRIREMPR